MDNDKGILLIAIANSYYGRMAYNLAVTIKSRYNIPIALIYDDAGVSHLTDSHKILFDKLILSDIQDAFSLKLCLDEYTPFTKTLYIDADTAWNIHKNPDDLFKELDGTKFTIANRGYGTGLGMWINNEQIQKQFGLERLLDCSSEVIYWESPEVFEKAREVHAMEFNYRAIGSSKPDEPCFAIAIELLGVEPHQLQWTPSFWYFAKPKISVSKSKGQIKNNYYLISAGGAHDSNTKTVENLYTDYVMLAFNEVKATPFPFIVKSKCIPGRKNY